MDVELIRQDFPILHQEVNGKPLVYLDSAASSQKPLAVIDAISNFYKTSNSNVHRGLHELSNRATAGYESARTRTARFINAKSADEIVFTRGTTESINLVASAWGLSNIKQGDVILLTEMEHHSNIVPWQMLAQRTGAKLDFIKVDINTGKLSLEGLEEQLKQSVKLVALTHISNSLGAINPVEEICHLAKKHGVVSLVDAAQSAGHRMVDVQTMGCDFLVFSSHKICGPTGIGVLYGRQEILESMPPYQGGGEMISWVKLEESEYKPAPHRFEAGTPDISGAVGLHAAMDYLDAIGRDAIAKHDLELASYAQEKILALDQVRVIGPLEQRAGLVSFQFDDIHAHDVVTFADQQGIALRGGHHCTQPLMRCLGLKSTARASFYFYNTRSEIDYLVDTLKETRHFFSRAT